MFIYFKLYYGVFIISFSSFYIKFKYLENIDMENEKNERKGSRNIKSSFM